MKCYSNKPNIKNWIIIENFPYPWKHYYKRIHEDGKKMIKLYLTIPCMLKTWQSFRNVMIEVNIKIYDKLAYDVSDIAYPAKIS